LEDEEMVSDTASDVVSDDGQGEVTYTQEQQDWELSPGQFNAFVPIILLIYVSFGAIYRRA
jgi:hypothetical protein